MIDVEKATVTFSRQLDAVAAPPVFGPLKTKRRRVVTLNADTIRLLKAHKAALKMRNRTTDSSSPVNSTSSRQQRPHSGRGVGRSRNGRSNSSARRPGSGRSSFTASGTCATLSLAATVPVHVVAKRLGHASAVMTLDVYGHVLDHMGSDAAAKLGAVLHG
jgi:integrase